MKAIAVIEAAKRDRLAFGDLVKRMDLTGKVHPAFKEMMGRGVRFPARHTERG